MKRIHYLAAEVFFYSYDNYDGHLGINDRFDRYMPEFARVLERAVDGTADVKEVAEKMDISEDEVPEFLERTKIARKIVDADTPAEGFREAVKQSIKIALEKGIDDEAAIDNLVGQICYRTADLSFLLKEREETLAHYSEELRS